LWYIYTIEYYSAKKKKEIKLFAGKWIELEIIMLSEISWTERQISHVFSHIRNIDLREKKSDTKCKMGTVCVYGGGVVRGEG
jgi:hypothetical protein